MLASTRGLHACCVLAYLPVGRELAACLVGKKKKKRLVILMITKGEQFHRANQSCQTMFIFDNLDLRISRGVGVYGLWGGRQLRAGKAEGAVWVGARAGSSA